MNENKNIEKKIYDFPAEEKELRYDNFDIEKNTRNVLKENFETNTSCLLSFGDDEVREILNGDSFAVNEIEIDENKMKEEDKNYMHEKFCESKGDFEPEINKSNMGTEIRERKVFEIRDNVDEKFDEILGYEELSHNYLEVYKKPHLNEIQGEKIWEMYLCEETNEKKKLEKIYLGNETYEKNKDSPINKIMQVTQTDNQELSRMEKLKSVLRYKHLEPEQKKPIEKLIEKYADCFHLKGEKLGTTSVITHKIPTINDVPVNVRPYRFPHALKSELDKQLKEMLDNEIIEPSCSNYSSPVFLVAKTPDSAGNKRYRLVVDFRQLNDRTVRDRYPLPNILDIIDQVGGAKYFSVFDLAQGFFQIPLDKADRHKTAFASSFGLFQFKTMPMGLSNSPATFQRCVDLVFDGMQQKEIFLFLDDAVIYGSTIEEHNEKFERFLQRLRKANLKLQPDKCEFLRTEVVYLGHVLCKEGVKPDPRKLQAVREFPQPRNIKNIRQFLGLAGYYRRFIHNFSGIAKPLSNLLKNDTPFIWSDETQKAFEELKDKLCTQPVLKIADFSLPFVLTCDASGVAIGGILSQGEIGKDRPIAYVSRVLSDTERKYDTYSREALAIVYAVNQFRPYLLGRKFTIVTDHKPLIWFKNSVDPTSRVSRWRIKLNTYDFDIVYKAGKMNCNADALSRNPVEENVRIIQTRSRTGNINKPNYRDKRPKKPNSHKNKILESPLEVICEEGPEPNEAIGLNQTCDLDFDSAEAIEGVTSDGLLNKTNEYVEDTLETLEEKQVGDEVVNDRGKFNCGKLFVECKDQLFMRKDNYIYFISTDGTPCDKGSLQLSQRKELPRFSHLSPGEIRITNKNRKLHFAIVLRDNKIASTTEILNNLVVALKVLKSIIIKEEVRSISMAKSDTIENVAWREILNKIRNWLRGLSLRIIICNGLIRYVEEEKRNEIMEEMHDSALGGHKGITKTYRRIKQKYYWENIKEDVQNYIRKCVKCQLKKLVRVKTKQPMIITDTPMTPLEKVSLDIVGPFPRSRNGHNNILTIQCNFSKYCLAIPLVDATAESVADAFIKRFICIFGSPVTILTDQGSNFMSSLMKRVAKKFRIKQIKTTAYHPQSNGSLERSHHSLSEYMKMFIEKNDTWDECLELATFSYNTVPHEGHQFTPYELIFGRLARLPSNEPLDPEEQPLTYNDYVTNLSNQLSKIQNIARKKLIDSKFKSKLYYDRKSNYKEFKLGDSVWLLKGGKPYKLADQYEGPYKIIEIINDKGNVKIKMDNNKTKIVHVNRLRIAYIDP